MRNFRLIIFAFTIFYSSIIWGNESQNSFYHNKKISDISFLSFQLKNENISQLLHRGVSAFVINNANANTKLIKLFPELKVFLDSNPQKIIFLIIKNKTDKNELIKSINNHQIKDYIFYQKSNITELKYADIIKSDKRIIIFTEDSTGFTFTLNNILFQQFDSISANRKNILTSKSNPLIYFDPQSNESPSTNIDSLSHRSFYIWLKQAIRPNFLVSPFSLIDVHKQIVDSLNLSLQYTGVVQCDNKVIDNLHWKYKNEYCESKGVFKFPKFRSDYSLYIPWKEGYKFYPEVIKFDNNTMHYELTATRLKLTDNLVYHFKFEKEALNEINKHTNAQLFKIQFKNSSEHGKVAFFNDRQAGIQIENSTQFKSSESFTISAWVKPESTDKIQTIISKGEVFSAKIRYNDISFAGTTFNSKISKSFKIEPKTWHHITFVYVPGYHVQFYVNGKIIFEDYMKQLPDNEQSLTIGNNFSNENFLGEMDDLRVWNRALSDEEIEELYHLKTKSIPFNDFLFFLIIAILITIFIFFFQKKKNKKVQIIIADNTLSKNPTSKNTNIIYLFGPFSLINESGENLSNLLSPKVKQLFILLIINRNGVTIQTLNEELWPGIEEEKAKQNRNYSIQQIKKALQNMPGVDLEYKAKHWRLEISASIHVDYFEFLFITSKLSNNNFTDINIIQEYIPIVEKGKFLQGIDAEMFDLIKGKIADEISEHLLNIATLSDNKLKLRIGNILLLHDSLNEDGLKLTVKSLSDSGRKGEAIEIFTTFNKRYQKIYGEDFLLKFQDLI